MGSLKGKTIQFISGRFIYLITVLALLSYAVTYLEGCFNLPIRADGAGYYAYLPTFLIYGDPTFEAVAKAQYGGEFPGWTFVAKHPNTARYLNTYNMGVALLMVPFFLIAHVLTFLFQSPSGGCDWWRFNHALDGYSFFYQHAAGLAGVFYFLFGLHLLKKSLERFFSPGVTLAGLAAILFGTSLYHYGTGETVMSHAYTFFLVALLVYVTPQWYATPGSRRWGLLLGLALGLLILTRMLNLLFYVLFALYGVHSLASLEQRVLFVWRYKWELLIVGVTAFLVFSPQLIVWKYSAGEFLVNPYRSFFRFGAPRLIEVFLGIKKGLLVWFPVLVFCLPGFCWMKKRVQDWFLPMLVFVTIFTVTVSSYFVCGGGGGFGNRYFADTWVVWSFPLTTFYDRIEKKWIKVVVAGFSVLLVGYTLFLMKMYYTRELSYEGLDAQAFFDILWLRKRMILDWGGRLFLR